MTKSVGPAWRHRLAASATVLLVATAGPAALAMEEPTDSFGMGGGDETATLLAEASELIEGGYYENARLALGAVLAEAPDSAEAWNQLGYLERRLQNFDKALQHYAKALTLAPEHTGALHYQAETFLALGRLEEAEANLTKIEAVCDFPCPSGDDLAEQIALYRKNLDG